jgi:hypothetical protein
MSKIHFKRFIFEILSVLLAVVFIIFIVKAGVLTPSSNPVATFYTLSDVYTRLTTNATSTEAVHDFNPGASPDGTFYTLSQIYNTIPTIEASKVLTGTAYLGVSGTALANLFDGSGQGFTGGSQTNGGVDDYNNGDQPPSDRYTCPAGWTQCTADNNYCSSGLSSSDAKDNCTNLIWSLPCKDTRCNTFTEDNLTISNATYAQDGSGSLNNGLTAAQLCTSGDHGQSGWYLPHQKQFIQAYIDGSYGNLEAINSTTNIGFYWSATVVSYATPAWGWAMGLANGTNLHVSKTSPTRFVRCARPAP